MWTATLWPHESRAREQQPATADRRQKSKEPVPMNRDRLKLEDLRFLVLPAAEPEKSSNTAKKRHRDTRLWNNGNVKVLVSYAVRNSRSTLNSVT